MPGACATTGSTRAATGAIGWVTSSASWPRPRSARPTAARHAPGERGTGPRPSRPDAATPPPSSEPSPPDPLDVERHARDLAVLDRLTRLAGRGEDLDDDLASAVSLIRDGYDHQLVAVWALRQGRLVPRADAHAPGSGPARLVDVPTTYGILGAALAAADGVATTDDPGSPLGDPVRRPHRGRRRHPGPDGPWGVLHLVTDADAARGRLARERRRHPRRDHRDASSRSPTGATRSASCSIAPRPCAGSPATSAATSTSTGS